MENTISIREIEKLNNSRKNYQKTKSFNYRNYASSENSNYNTVNHKKFNNYNYPNYTKSHLSQSKKFSPDNSNGWTKVKSRNSK